MNLYTQKTRDVANKGFNAAETGDEITVKKLIESSFNTCDCDEYGNSLLHYAVRGRNLNIIRYLVEQCGMDPTWSNRNFETPFDIAHKIVKEGGNNEIEVYFERICRFTYDSCYRNPVCHGMSADPSIVRVGDDYYMVNSGFVYFPCIPISHSKDLIHWNVIGHVITDMEWAFEHLCGLEGGRGFWAPDISYYDNKFYVCATLRNNDDHEFIQTQVITSSDNPEGPYETPIIHNIRGIDPSIFTDDNGLRYMLINRGARIMKISSDGKRILSEPKLVWHGHCGKAPEGPHLIKKDGYYYCFMAEGGTGKGHMISVGRSKNLLGPYEDCPYNPIMIQRDEISPIQCCGHGKPVETPDGRWFIVYLCSRLLDGKWGILGRETCLDEIIWTNDGWPLINFGKGPSYMNKLPFVEDGKNSKNQSINHNDIMVAPRVIDNKYIQIEDDGSIAIKGNGRDLCDIRSRSLLLKFQPDFKFSFEYEMEVPEEELNEFSSDAGVTLYYDENTYFKFGVNISEVFVKEYVDNKYVRNFSCKNILRKRMKFRIETDGLERKFYFNNKLLCTLADVKSICSEGLTKGKRFTGAMYGVYVNGKNFLRWRQHGNL